MRNSADVEKLLVDVGAVKLDDHRLRRVGDDLEPESRAGLKSSANQTDDDSDWD
jgi:hypothetical protein